MMGCPSYYTAIILVQDIIGHSMYRIENKTLQAQLLFRFINIKQMQIAYRIHKGARCKSYT